jgi:medium-chain acyl-[acyl-carrier-protein] hydrolase
LASEVIERKYLWTQKYSLRYSEMDFKQVLKPSALMNFLQDMATENAEMLGFGPSFVFPKNYAWFLIKYRMEFDDYPQELNELVFKTEPRGISKIIASRDFEIWSPDEKKQLGRVASNWMMIDLSNKSILPLAKLVTTMPPLEKRESDLKFEKIAVPETFNFEKTFEIRYDDIDVNQHVNNANYIIWAFETLPHDFKANHKLKTLDVLYKKEIAFGHDIISQVQLQDKVSTHVLKNATTGEDLCHVCANWV